MARVGHLLVGILLLLAYYAGIPGHAWHDAPEFVPPVPATAVPAPGDGWIPGAASDALTPMVHASSLVELPDGRLRGFWFAGSREGAADVTINSAVFDPRTGLWSEERPVVSRLALADQLGMYLRKLGNAVPVMDPDGRMRLFVVAVSFGGWAASRIAVLESDDLGESFGDAKLLVTSPFLNVSTLVKGPPLRFTDGTLGLPVYHEMIGKFGEVLRIDDHNRILGKQRIGQGRGSIQPVVFVDGPAQAGALLRNERADHSEGLLMSSTVNGGRNWSPLVPAGLPNPSAAVGGAAVGRGHWLVAANCNPHERDDLCLVETRNGGRDWQLVHAFHDRAAFRGTAVAPERLLAELAGELAGIAGAPEVERVLNRARANKCRAGACEFQYDYPFLLRTRNGDIHMLYTWNKTLIRHAWWRAGAVRETTP